MKKVIGLSILALLISGVAWAQAPFQTDKQMQMLAYGSVIDQKAAFYQKRIYLADSEYKILADIGKDAIQRVSFLKANRQQLVRQMMADNVKLKKSSLDAFMVAHMGQVRTTMEAYSTE